MEASQGRVVHRPPDAGKDERIEDLTPRREAAKTQRVKARALSCRRPLKRQLKPKSTHTTPSADRAMLSDGLQPVAVLFLSPRRQSCLASALSTRYSALLFFAIIPPMEREFARILPYLLGGMFLLGVLTLLIALQQLRVRRTGAYWLLRRRAGERGGRLFLIAVGLIVSSLALTVVSGLAAVAIRNVNSLINRNSDDLYGIVLPSDSALTETWRRGDASLHRDPRLSADRDPRAGSDRSTAPPPTEPPTGSRRRWQRQAQPQSRRPPFRPPKRRPRRPHAHADAGRLFEPDARFQRDAAPADRWL